MPFFFFWGGDFITISTESWSVTHVTPPKTNIEPENHSFEKETHLPNLHFGVPC